MDNNNDNMSSRMTVVEMQVDDLQHKYDQLQEDVSELRDDITDLKDKVAQVQIENTKNFSDVKDLLNGVTNKALNSMPPWGVALTLPFGAIVGVVIGVILPRFL